jgi:hypothetical protein
LSHFKKIVIFSEKAANFSFGKTEEAIFFKKTLNFLKYKKLLNFSNAQKTPNFSKTKEKFPKFA